MKWKFRAKKFPFPLNMKIRVVFINQYIGI